MSRQLFIVSHSHWDREWHQTFQQFRLRLVQLVDSLLDLLGDRGDFVHFMLDGQTILLEDYAEMRPERQAELRGQIAAGRLAIGPWYVQPDEFLVSGEALVRNLLLGRRLCREWGGRMDLGYVPDQFGHIAQLPQLLRGFGMEIAVLWRGVDADVAGLAFTWRGHDASTVLGVTLPGGYANGERLPRGGQALAGRLRAVAAALERVAATEQPLLVMNGGDHQGVQAELPDALQGARPLLEPDYLTEHSTLSAYVQALRLAAVPQVTLEGELRSPRSAFLLPAVLSSRMWIKVRNSSAQALLERSTEPLTTIAAALGAPYPGGELRQSWRYLLQNHAHDSICGCSVDQVHREMATRFDWSEQIATALRDTALAHLAERVNSIVPGADDPHTLAITVFNGAPAAQAGRLDLHLHLVGEAQGYEVVDAAGVQLPHLWLGQTGEAPTEVDLPIEDVPDLATIMMQVDGDRVMGAGIQAVTIRTTGDTLHLEITAGDQTILKRAEIEEALRDAFALAESAACKRVLATIHRSADLHLALRTPMVAACGYTTLLLRPRDRSAGVAPGAQTMELLPTIENEHYRVDVDAATGTLILLDRAGGMQIGPANIYIDGADAGDLYTYCPPAQDAIASSATVAPEIQRQVSPLGQVLQLRAILHVPRALDASRNEREAEHIPLEIETTVTLAPGDPLVRFRTTVTQHASDHRLRTHITIPFTPDHAYAEDPFAMVRRQIQPATDGDWAEIPVATAPHQGLVALEGAGGAVVLAAPGLPEYEVIPGSGGGGADLALTLLRCVGWLSRSDLVCRRGDAGPSLPVPEAQCHGRHQFTYALAFGRVPWRELLPAARTFAVSLVAHVAPCTEGFLPPAAALISVEPPAVVLSSLKGAEDGTGAILRLYNDDTVTHLARLRLLLKARRIALTSLAEEDAAILHDGEPIQEFVHPFLPGQIASFRIEWAPV